MSSSSAKGTCTASWQVTSRTITRPALISPSTRMHPTGGQSSRRDPARSSRFPKSVVYIIATFGGRRSQHEPGRSSRHTTSLLHSGRWPSSAGEPYPTGTDPVENRPGRGWRQPLCLTGFPASAGFSHAHGRSRNEPNGVSAKDNLFGRADRACCDSGIQVPPELFEQVRRVVVLDPDPDVCDRRWSAPPRYAQHQALPFGSRRARRPPANAHRGSSRLDGV